MKIFIFLIIILVVGSLLIIENNNLSISKKDDANLFVDYSAKWAGNVYSNFIEITGNAVRMSWLPE